MKRTLYCCVLIVFTLTACGGAGPTPTITLPVTHALPATTAPNSPDSPPDSAVTIVPTQIVPTNPPGCTNSASFVKDVTVPDNTRFEAGAAVHKVWRIRNTGTCAWNSQYTLIFLQGDQMDAVASTRMELTPSGGTVDILMDLTAPAADGTYRADFEIHAPDGAAILIDQSTLLWVILKVGAVTAGEGGSAGDTNISGGDSTSSGGVGGGSNISGGSGLASVTCAYTTDSSRVSSVIAAIQSYRAQQGLPPFAVSDTLGQAAQAHSADMACNSLFYHNGSNGSTTWSRVVAVGYGASYVTENVYGSYPPLTGQGVVSWWANDATDVRHNENLLSTNYSVIGVGYAFFNNYGYYVVDFAVPE